MKKVTKIWMIIAGAAIGIGAILMIVASTIGGVTGVYLDSDWKIRTIRPEDSETYDSEPMKDIKEIAVNLHDDNIVIRESGDEYFHVHVDSTFGGRSDVSEENGKLSVEQNSYKRFVSIDFTFRPWRRQDEVIVYVPRNADLKELKLKTSDGNITLEAAMTSQKTEVVTSSGNISVMDLKSNDTTIQSSDGNIVSNGAFVNSTSIKTSSGNITATGSYQGQVKLKTSDGNVGMTISEKRADSSIHAKTSDGTVRINNSKVGNDFEEKNASKNSYELKTSSGNVTIEIN